MRVTSRSLLIVAIFVGIFVLSGSAGAQGTNDPVDKTYIIGDGQTKIDMSQAFWKQTYINNGILLGSIGSASLRTQSWRFPVVAGAIDRVQVIGEINHTGGLFLQKEIPGIGTIRVSVVSLTVDLTQSPAVLTGLLIFSDSYQTLNTGSNYGRVNIAELSLPPSMAPPIKEEPFKTIYKQDITALIHADLAGLLNLVFNTTSFSAGDSIGSVSFFLVGVPSREHLVEDFIFRY